MKKILFLFGFLACSFGTFASSHISEIPKTKHEVEITNTISEDIPNLILIIIKGEGAYTYDDGSPCLTIFRVDGYFATTSKPDCP